jgi:hypothetical protein
MSAEPQAAVAPLRPPAEIMSPARLGMFKASRLSFGCAIVDTMIAERWQVRRTRWDLDGNGRGIAVYAIDPGDGRELNYIVLSVLVPVSERVGTSYATKFDVLGSLLEGPVTDAYLERFVVEIQRKPTEGQAGHETLAWVRANRSARAFDATVASLAAGRQPDSAALCGIGYLLRTVYYQANGMQGTRSFKAYGADHPLWFPYASQSLGSYLTREFANDLVDHLARVASPRAVALDRSLRRYLGLGNSTGLGLVILVVNHPRLMDRWIRLREQAVAAAAERVEPPGSEAVARLRRLLDRCATYRAEDDTPYGDVFMSGPELARELGRVRALVDELAGRGTPAAQPWGALCARVARELAPETLECVHALLADLYPDTAAALLRQSVVSGIDELHPEIREVDVRMPLPELREILRAEYDWAFAMDTTSPDAWHWRWYKAAVGEYPGVVPMGAQTRPFEDYARDTAAGVCALDADLAAAGGTSLAPFLLAHPEHRATVQWVQTARGLAYATPRMNMRARDYQPMEITRFVLECIKGFEKMEPVDAYGGRAIIMQGAPTAPEIAAGADPVWTHPPIPRDVRSR